MTREEAIDIIKCLAWHTRPDEEDVERAIKALEQQPCEDYISRAKAIEEADKLCLETDYDNEQVIEMLNDLPSVTPKEKTGHWVNAKVGKLFPSNDYKCSECGNLLDFDGINCGRGDANYCPNCGARMIEPQESEG